MYDDYLLGEHAFVTKLAGFEHTKYIQHNAVHYKDDIPLVIGKNIKNGKVIYKFDWYISEEISNLLPRSVLDKKCIVIPYVGSRLGELAVFQNDFKCHLGSNVAKVELIDDLIDLSYLYYYLKSSYGQSQLFKDKQGSAQPNITMTSIRNTRIRIFNKESQKNIVDVLSVLDKKIELNNKINKELETMAKTLYDYWFVQFDFPDENGKPYKSSGGKMIYNKELKREIPKDWGIDSLWNIATYFNGLAMQKHRPIDDNKKLRVIKIKEMNDGFSDKTEFARDDINEDAIIENGDILFSWSATLDVKIWAKGKGALNQHIFKITSDKYPRTFYYYELLNYLQHFKMMAERRKTTMGHITQEHLKQSKIVVPPIELINKLDKKINPMLEKIVLNELENQKLTELRDWLLPMLMNGQVSVKDSKYINSQNDLLVAQPKPEYN